MYQKNDFLISQPKHVMGTQKNRLNETVLLSTRNICQKLWVRKCLQFNGDIFCLSKPMRVSRRQKVNHYENTGQEAFIYLKFASWVIFHAFLSSANFFPKPPFSKKYFRNTFRVSNSLNPGQARHSVHPDPGPNCLKRLSD